MQLNELTSYVELILGTVLGTHYPDTLPTGKFEYLEVDVHHYF